MIRTRRSTIASRSSPTSPAEPNGSPNAPMASNSDLNNPDIQTYENQQKLDNQTLNQQQQAI